MSDPSHAIQSILKRFYLHFTLRNLVSVSAVCRGFASRSSRVSYPGPGFLSSATWPLMRKKDTR